MCAQPKCDTKVIELETGECGCCVVTLEIIINSFDVLILDATRIASRAADNVTIKASYCAVTGYSFITLTLTLDLQLCMTLTFNPRPAVVRPYFSLEASRFKR